MLNGHDMNVKTERERHNILTDRQDDHPHCVHVNAKY